MAQKKNPVKPWAYTLYFIGKTWWLYNCEGLCHQKSDR